MLRVFCAFTLWLSVPGLALADSLIHHELRVKLTPDKGRISVSDIIHLPPAVEGRSREWTLDLHPQLSITQADPPLQLSPGATAHGLKRYTLTKIPPQGIITLSYEGKIDHPLQELASGLGHNLEATRGFIGGAGVYLDGNSYWYPQLNDQPVSFSLEVQLPAGWSAISQGARVTQETDEHGSRVRWEETQPQEEIYLIANRYHAYQHSSGAVSTLVLLRQPDAALAERYLAAMTEYIDLYSRLIGPYPYAKFALVENTWESGYGMPSFTLLGPQVIRLPFILRSSFPHEIVHNWWGNGVYVDYRGGNWAEGLTAYLADHLLKEQNGEGPAYRRDALLRYTNYVAAERDFPLGEFRARHSGASQAIGYDKALMLFHALRLQLGDAAFIAALQHFYSEQKFKTASWRELRAAFEKQAGASLQTFFEQGLQRSGAPALRITAARATAQAEDYQLELTVEQTQAGAAYLLNLPIAITLDGHDEALLRTITVDGKSSVVKLRVPARPWRVEVDPDFDVFRRLAAEELPPTLSEALGAEHLTIVLPAAAPPAAREAYQHLAQIWASSGEQISLVWDDKLGELPKDSAVWLFGWENRFQDALRVALSSGGVLISDTGVHIAGQDLRRDEHAVVLSARRKAAPVLMWLGCDNQAAFAGLARKLPHYGNTSYLAFRGDAPDNFLKGQWRVNDSPLNIAVTQADGIIATALAAPHKSRPALSALLTTGKK